MKQINREKLHTLWTLFLTSMRISAFTFGRDKTRRASCGRCSDAFY
ncbi:MAG: hypothetical protein IJP98_03195 [Clostridia bacterium]|nr:hypothetical protein [Clostridia bacterium]